MERARRAARRRRRIVAGETMLRTTIMLPQGLRAGAMARARKKGISLGALIRQVLEAEVEGAAVHFLDRDIVFRGRPPADAPRHHDDIYDAPPPPAPRARQRPRAIRATKRGPKRGRA